MDERPPRAGDSPSPFSAPFLGWGTIVLLIVFFILAKTGKLGS
jgi:hypothetical protein